MALILFFFAVAAVLSSSTSYGFWTKESEDVDWTTVFEVPSTNKLIPSTMKSTKRLKTITTTTTKEKLDDLKSSSTDPEVNMGPVEIIKRWNYPAEEYTVMTGDGYLLSVQRIPGPRWSSNDAFTSADAKNADANENSKPVLFLMHGILASATNWIANLPNQSLAFMAADAGFDVWLGNARGNTYSKRHTQFDPKGRNFWKFSWDEIAKYDIPAMVNYALWKSQKKQLYYAGHSQGSLVMFAKASEDLEFGKKIKKFFAMGPVTTVGNVIGAARLFGKIHGIISAGSWITGLGEFLPKNNFIDSIAKTFCKSPLKAICSNILFLLSGQDTVHLNQTRLPVYLTHTPAGTSAQNVVHFGQMIQTGKCQKHDYGFVGNMWRYGTYKAPEYAISKLEVPTVLFWGGKDLLADPEDVQTLIPKIKNLKGNYFDPEMDHLDYIWGSNAADGVYSPIIRMIRKDEE